MTILTLLLTSLLSPLYIALQLYIYIQWNVLYLMNRWSTRLLKKTPTHIALVSLKPLELGQIKDILTWMDELNQPHCQLTLYDPQGGYSLLLKQWMASDTELPSIRINKKMVHTSSSPMTLSVLSYNDKMPQLATQCVGMNQDQINAIISQEYPPEDDPELVYIIGNGMCLFGYPPWHLRLSQLHHVQFGWSRYEFNCGLESFSSCEQRHGK